MKISKAQLMNKKEVKAKTGCTQIRHISKTCRQDRSLAVCSKLTAIATTTITLLTELTHSKCAKKTFFVSMTKPMILLAPSNWSCAL